VCGFLDPNRRKARYGVAFVRSLCAQAGLSFSETSADEDVLAVDGEVGFTEGIVRVQVKCTSSLKIAGRRASWPLDEGWVRKWSDSRVPVYFVLVIVDEDPGQWLEQRRNGTYHNAAAFWERVDLLGSEKRLTIPKSNRLDASTFDLWHAQMLECFSPRKVGGAP
jgi:hypothetical protein